MNTKWHNGLIKKVFPGHPLNGVRIRYQKLPGGKQVFAELLEPAEGYNSKTKLKLRVDEVIPVSVFQLTITMASDEGLSRASVAELLEFVAASFRSEVDNHSDEVVTDDEEDRVDFRDHDDVRAIADWWIEGSGK